MTRTFLISTYYIWIGTRVLKRHIDYWLHLLIRFKGLFLLLIQHSPFHLPRRIAKIFMKAFIKIGCTIESNTVSYFWGSCHITLEEFHKALEQTCKGKKYDDFPLAFKFFINASFKAIDFSGILFTIYLYNQGPMIFWTFQVMVQLVLKSSDSPVYKGWLTQTLKKLMQLTRLYSM